MRLCPQFSYVTPQCRPVTGQTSCKRCLEGGHDCEYVQVADDMPAPAAPRHLSMSQGPNQSASARHHESNLPRQPMSRHSSSTRSQGTEGYVTVDTNSMGTTCPYVEEVISETSPSRSSLSPRASSSVSPVTVPAAGPSSGSSYRNPQTFDPPPYPPPQSGLMHGQGNVGFHHTSPSLPNTPGYNYTNVSTNDPTQSRSRHGMAHAHFNTSPHPGNSFQQAGPSTGATSSSTNATRFSAPTPPVSSSGYPPSSPNRRPPMSTYNIPPTYGDQPEVLSFVGE